MLLLNVLAWAQAQVLETRAADVMQYLSGIGIVTLVGLAVRSDRRVANIETLLREPGVGLIARITRTAQQTHDHANSIVVNAVEIQNLKARLDRAED